MQRDLSAYAPAVAPVKATAGRQRMPMIAGGSLAWPDAVAIVGVAIAIAIAYTAWRLTGGRHLGEKRTPYRNERT